jgi:putative ABC transport system ATP-binding protein
MADEQPIVRMKDVRKRYRAGRVDSEVLHGIDLEVKRGELCAIVGTSGSGKTTVLNVIGGLDRDYTGEVWVTGEELGKLSDAAVSHLRNEKVGFVFQHFNLLEHLSCLENVAMPAIFSRHGVPDARDRARTALERVGLGARADDLPSNLSGGQKQRVAIARALFNRPPLLLCDEPTGNLDTRTGQQIIDLFTALNREDGISLVIVTHESRVSSAAHRVVRLEDGRISDVDGRIGVEAAEPT